MKNKIFASFSVIFMLVAMLTGCTKSSDHISSAADLNRKNIKIGTVQGASPMYITEENFPNADIEYYATVSDAVTALTGGKADALVYTKIILDYYEKNSDNIEILDDVVGYADISVGMKKGNTELKAKVDEFIAKAAADGTLDDMEKRWKENPDHAMPDIEKPENPEGTLRIITEGLETPFTFFGDNGQLMGIDIEFGTRLAYYLNMDVSFESMNFDALFPTLEAGKADIVLNELNANTERDEVVLFSEPYYHSEVVAVINTDKYKYKRSEKKFASISDFSGETISLDNGSALDLKLKEILPDHKEVWMPNISAGAEDVKSGKSAAYLTDLPIAKNAVSRNSELEVFPQLLFEEDYAYCFPKYSKYLDDFNNALAQLKENGTLDEIDEYWIESSDTDKRLMPQKSTGANGTIKIGGAAETEPMVYMNGEGEIIGRDIAVCNAICDMLDLKAEYVNVGWDALSESVTSGKIDLFCGSVSITEERREIMDFCDPTYSGGAAFIVRKDRIAASDDLAVLDSEKLSSAKFGVMQSSLAIGHIEEKYPDAQIMEFDAIGDAVEALKSNKVDYVMTAYSTAKNFERYNKELCVYDGIKFNERVSMAVRKGNTELKNKLDDVLDGYKKDGTLDKIIANWISEDGGEAAYNTSDIPVDTNASVLNVGISANREPMCFIMDGKYCGVDCELIERIAYDMGMRVEYRDMKFSALIPALESGKADVIISNIAKSEERARAVDFT